METSNRPSRSVPTSFRREPKRPGTYQRRRLVSDLLKLLLKIRAKESDVRRG